MADIFGIEENERNREHQLISPQEAGGLKDQDFSPDHRQHMVREALHQAEGGPSGGSLRGLDQEEAWSNFVDILMLADGYSFDSLFSADPRMAEARAYYGSQAHARLEQGAGEEWLEEVFRRAGGKLLEAGLPNYNIAAREITEDMPEEAQSKFEQMNREPRKNVQRAQSLAQLMRGYRQLPSEALQSSFLRSPHAQAHRSVGEALEWALPYCDAVHALGVFYKTVDEPGSKYLEAANVVQGRFYFDEFCRQKPNYAGSISSAWSSIDKDAFRTLLADAAGITEDANALAYVSSPLAMGRSRFGFYLDGRGKIHKGNAADGQEIDIRVAEGQDAKGVFAAAPIFEALEAQLSRSLMDERAEHFIKRIYVNGENAYEKYQKAYNGSETNTGEREQYIRTQITRDIIRGVSRVELAQMETDPVSGTLHVNIFPIHADFSGTSAQAAVVEAYEKLWSEDPEKGARHQQIAQKALDRQGHWEAERRGMGSLNRKLTAQMDETHKNEPYASQYQALARAESVMAEDPSRTREWISLRMQRDLHRQSAELKKWLELAKKAADHDVSVNEEEFSEALVDFARNLQFLRGIGEQGGRRPTGTEVEHAFDDIIDAARKPKEERMARFHELFRPPSEGLPEGSLELFPYKGLEQLIGFYRSRGDAAAFSQEDAQRLDALDRQFIGFTEQEAPVRYRELERVYDTARTMRSKELSEAGGAAVTERYHLDLREYPPDEVRLYMRNIDQAMAQTGVTASDVAAFVESLPEGGKRQQSEGILEWARINKEECGLFDPLSLKGLPPLTDLAAAMTGYYSMYQEAALFKAGYIDCILQDDLDHMMKLRRMYQEQEEQKQALRREVPEAQSPAREAPEAQSPAREENLGARRIREEQEAWWAQAGPLPEAVAEAIDKRPIPLPMDTERLMRVRQMNGSLSRLESAEEMRVLEDGAAFFDAYTADMQALHPIYQTLGITDCSQLFYIDGQPAEEYVRARAGGRMPSNPAEARRLIRAELGAAILASEHRIDYMQIVQDEKGNFQVGVTTVRPDLHALDGGERWYQRKPSKKAQQLYDNDSDRAKRTAAIRQSVGEKLFTLRARQLMRDSDPYREGKKRFALTRLNVLLGDGAAIRESRRYFGDEGMQVLQTLKLPGEADRGGTQNEQEFGGLRLLAGLLTMARNPQVRYADLADPEKYPEEKQNAAREVLRAVTAMYPKKEGAPQNWTPDPEPLAQVLADSLQVIGSMDVKRELLYAFGASPDASPEEVRRLMKEESPAVTELFSSMGATGQQFMQLVSSMSGDREMSDILRGMNDGDNLGSRITQKLSEPQRRSIENAALFLRHGLFADQKISRTAGNYFQNPETSGKISLGTLKAESLVWDMIARDGKIGAFDIELTEAVNQICLSEGKEYTFKEAAYSNMRDIEAELSAAYKEIDSRTGNFLKSQGSDMDAHLNGQRSRLNVPLENLKHAMGTDALAADRRTQAVHLLMLSDDAYTLHSVFPGKPEQKFFNKGLAALMQGLEEHPLFEKDGDGRWAEVPEDIRRESLHFYGQMYAKAAQRLGQADLPEISWEKPLEIPGALSKISRMGTLAREWLKGMEEMREKYGMEFMSAFDPEQRGMYEKQRAGMEALSQLAAVTDTYLSKDDAQPIERAAARVFLESCKNQFAGRRAESLEKRDGDWIKNGIQGAERMLESSKFSVEKLREIAAGEFGGREQTQTRRRTSLADMQRQEDAARGRQETRSRTEHRQNTAARNHAPSEAPQQAVRR